MILNNHIANRFLKDDKLTMEIVETTFPGTIEHFNGEVSNNVQSLYNLCCPKDQKAYYVSKSVFDKLDMLKLKKTADHYNWSVFKNIPEGKRTFIMPNEPAYQSIIRMQVIGDTIAFCMMTLWTKTNQNGMARMNWELFYLNRATGELCTHFENPDVRKNEPFIYSLLCFLFLTDNDEIIVHPGQKYGTKKSPDNLLNDIRVPITIINSRWNTVVNRTEGFDVRGHFALRRCGENFSDYKIVFIEPFRKEGYHRGAQKETTQI